jgi:hypothetical protein
MQFRKISQHNSCVFLGFFVPFSGKGSRIRKASALAKLPRANKGVDRFSTGELDNSRSAQAMGDGMAKARKTKKTERKPKRAKDRGPSDPGLHIIAPPHALHDEFVSLNDAWGKAKVVLLPVEPYTVHVYWELNPEAQKRAGKGLGQESSQVQPILRFYDVTGVFYDGTNARGFFDIPVDLPDRNCYVKLWSPHKTYFVDLGWRTEQGTFIALGRSNTADTPRAWPAETGPHLPKRVEGSFHEAKDLGKTEQRNTISTMKKVDGDKRPANGDLTARSEQAFEFGISSEQTSSSLKKRGCRED